MGKKKTKYSKIIANYLYNDMSQEERKQFEKDLLVNEELSNEYELQASAVKYLKARITLEEMESDPDLAAAEKLAEEILDEELESSPREITSSSIVPSSKRIPIRILAAAILLIGIVSTTLIISNNSNQSLYESFYGPFDETYLTYRGDNESMGGNITAGIRIYSEKNYVESIEVFQNIKSSNPDNPHAIFYLGLSLMGTNDFDGATFIFKNYLNSFEVYQPEVKWYLALCFLKMDSVDESYQLLQELSSYPGKYGENSKKLAKKLERKLDR